MSILDDSRGNGFFMPVAPAYSGNGGMFSGMGGDWIAWFILVLLIGGNGWGMGGFGMGGVMPWLMGGLGGMGAGYGLDYLYPWLNNSQHISDGFRDQYLNTQVGDLRTDVNRGFGDVQLGISGLGRQICETGNGITQALNNGFSSAEIAANGRQMANMQQNFGLQTQVGDLKYTVATEACADRAAVSNALNTVLTHIDQKVQGVHDKLCQLELDGYKRDNDQLRSENSALKNQSFIAAEINQQNEIFYNRLKNCPVNAVPVAGNTPLFNCNPGFNSPNGCGCGNGGNFR